MEVFFRWGVSLVTTKKVLLTDAMDVLFCGFSDLETLLSENSGIPEAQLKSRIHEELDDPWRLCRGEITETTFWWEFIRGLTWKNDEGEVVEPYLSDFLQVFRNNMKRSVPGTFELYQRIVKEHGVQLFLASDHFSEMVPKLIEWHREVFRAIPEGNRFWSCNLGLVKRDQKFFPRVLGTMREALGIEREDIVFVDDSATNVEVARQNGIDAIRFTSAEQLNTELKSYGLDI